MSILINFISLVVMCGLILLPFIILYILKMRKSNHRFTIFTTFSITIGIMIIYAYSLWLTNADTWLLSYYGYDINGLTESERFANVSPNNIVKVRVIESSISGIGWQLKALFTCVLYLPYLLVVYFISYLKTRRRFPIRS